MNTPRIGILTFHRVWNAGAFLLALSLYETLRAQGFDVYILDFHPKAVKTKLADHFGRNPVRWIRRLRSFNYSRRMYNIYGELQNHFEIISPVSNGIDISKAHIDVVICSADVWNYDSKWCKGEDLFFGKGIEAKKLIGYGVSLGKTDHEKQPPPKEVLAGVSRFTHVFPRDLKTEAFANKYSHNVEGLTLDAAFFLKVEKYIKPNSLDFPYLAVCAFSKWLSDSAVQEIREYAGAHRLKIVAPAYPQSWADISLPYVDPFEWLNILFYSDCVFSGTFHAAVFSLLLKKRFAAQMHPGIEQKTRDMLYAVGANRSVYTNGALEEILEGDFDYSPAIFQSVQSSSKKLFSILSSF